MAKKRKQEETFQANVLCPALDSLEALGKLKYFHVPNGGSRNKIEAANLKRAGVKSGVPDLVVVSTVDWIPIIGFLEVKKPWQKGCGQNRGVLSPSQKEWRDWLRDNGHKWALVESLNDMLNALADWGILPK